MRHKRAFMAFLSVAPIALAAPAWGKTAEPPADQSGATDDPLKIEEIVVQARRISESQQDVPIAVSTVTGDRLEEVAASSAADVARLVPSLQISYGPTGQTDFTIRGSFGGFGVDPAVVTYLDEVPIDSRTLSYGLFDIQSVQQLKGPQGTLFGRNSTGGAVLFFAKKPDLSEMGGYLNVRLGNLEDRRIEAAINLPVNDRFGLRIAGQLQRRDGLIESVTTPGLQFENRRNQALRVSTLWDVTDNIENYTQFTHYRVRENRYPQVIITLAGPCTGPATPAPVCLYQPPFNSILGTGNIRNFFNQQQALPGNRTVNDVAPVDNIDRDSITNTLTIDLGGVSLRNTTYYGDANIDYSRDFDGTPVKVVDSFTETQDKTFYTEMQLFGSAFGDRLDWRVGGVFSRDKSFYRQTVALFPIPSSLVQPKRTDSSTLFKSTAVFGQATLEVIDGLSLTAGARYTWDDRKIATTAFAGRTLQTCALQVLPVPATGPVPFPNTDLATCTRKLSAKFDDYNYNFTVDWKPVDGVLLYASARRGYKTGSFNTFETNPALQQYEPEVVKDIEIGLKADWRIGDIPIRTNIAGFRSRYTNIQTSRVAINPASGDVNVIVINGDAVTGLPTKATTKGFEIETTIQPARWLQISGFYSDLEAKYDRFFSPSPRTDLSGQPVSSVVPKTYGVSATANIPIDGFVDSLDFSASYYRSSTPQSNALTTVFLPAREAIDARVSARNLFGSGFSVSLYGRNLGDKVYCPTNTLVTGALTQTCSEPRTYGVELSYRFGSEQR